MAELTTLARPYARAAFLLATEQKALEQWEQVLALAAAAVEEPRVRALLERPELGSDEKVSALVNLCGDACGKPQQAFLTEMERTKRLLLLPEVARQFHRLVAEHSKFADVQLVSAFELQDEQTRSLAEALQRRLGMEVHLSTRVDPSLVGGVVVQAGDTVIDGSLRGRLKRLSEQLNS